MKKHFLLLFAFVLPAMLIPARAATVIFSDTFSSSTLNGTSTPGGTPEASSTSYDIASTKNGTSCSIAADKLQLKLGGGTTAGYIELQAIFASAPVQLINVGDRLNLTFTFTNSSGTLLAGGNGSVIDVGLFNSGGNLPVAGLLNNAGLGSATTYISGNCQNWQGYVGQLNYNGSLSSIFTRPMQTDFSVTAANNGVQDLLFSGAGTGLFRFPTGTAVGSTLASTVTLIAGGTYTRSFTVKLSAANEVTITDELYSGDVAAGIPLSSLVRTTSSGNTYTNFSNQYDGLAIGIANKGTSFNPLMDVSRIIIAKSTKADEPALYNVQLNGFTNSTFVGAARIGGSGDVWNNPDWAGVYNASTNLFSDVPVLDATGTDNGVTATMTSKFNNNTGDWNTGSFNHYTGQTAGTATPVLVDQLAKIDYSAGLGGINVITLLFSGLPTNTPVTAYVYGSGNGVGQGTKWSLAVTNGGGSANTVTDNTANPTGRDVTLASSKGYGWNSISGTTDGSGKFTIIADGNAGSTWWQVYLNGIQLQVGGTAPTIFGLTNQTAEAGSTVIMSPLVTGNPVPTCQWQENGVDMPGETGSMLTLTNVTTGQSNYVYSLIANNPLGTVTNSMTLTVNEPVYSSMSVTVVSPNNGVTGICFDTPLTVTFSDTISLGTLGAIKIFNVTNPAAPVDTINAASGLVQQRTFPGDNQSFSYQTIHISGNTARIYPHFNVLTSNQTYYVTIDPKTFKDSGGVNFIGLTATNVWKFTTKSAPVDPINPTVNTDGSADFLTVQGAVNSIPAANTTPTVIQISNGDYNEIVDIAGKHNVTFRGQSRAGVLVGFSNNSNFQAANGGTTHARMAFKVNANDISIQNLTVTNRTPQGGSQAEALMIESNAKRCIIENVNLLSRQDTILANQNSSQACFHNSRIDGNFDYIWGGGNLFFENCEIRTIAGSSSFNVTAARTDTGATQSSNLPWANPGGTYTANGMSFVNCTFTAEPGVGTVTLAGSNGAAGNNVSWYGCDFATNYVAPSASLFSGNFVFWQAANTMTNSPVTFAVITTISGTDARLLAATNIPTWFYGWEPQLPPNIITNPAGQSVFVGHPVSFSVSATGIPTPTFQWKHAGTNLIGETGASLTIASAQITDAGDYTVEVSSGGISVVSATATLTVMIPVAPTLSNATISSNGSFQFEASGGDGQTYRIWASADAALMPITDTWTLLSSGEFGAGPVTFTDTQATNYPQRFYLITVP